MNTNISEAAKRAIALCRERHNAGRLVSDSEMETLLQQALSSAQPVEGEPPETDAAEARLKRWHKRSLEANMRGSHLDSDDPMPQDGFAVARSLELRLAQKTARLQQAEELLRPLANLDITSADNLKHEDARPIFGLNATQINVGDVRSARSFLNQPKL